MLMWNWFVSPVFHTGEIPFWQMLGLLWVVQLFVDRGAENPADSLRWGSLFLVLAHDRRRILHFNVTAHPTAEWTGQQLREAFPFEQVPCCLLRDRDAIFGEELSRQVTDMGIHEVLSAPRAPWQRAYVERVIGSIRRECLDHVIVFQESSLRRILDSYFEYYHRSRTHLSLGKDSPNRDRFSRRKWGEPSRFRSWADYITGTNDGPPEESDHPLASCGPIP
jgi:putative transposase